MTDTRELARGRWREILSRLGADGGLLDGKHRPCPACGGKDRFRFDDKEGRGTHICSQCGAGDGFELVQKMFGYPSFKEAAQAVEQVLGIEGQAPSREQQEAYRRKLDDECATRKAQQEQSHRAAAIEAQRQYKRTEPSNAEHPHITAKGVSLYGLYDIIRMRDGSLIIPIMINGIITSLQAIDWKGNKRFLKGGEITGGGCVLPGGDPANAIIFIGEGLVTCLTVREATGQTVIVAFNAGNLKAVAQSIRARYPDYKIIIAADNDHHTEGNPGISKGKAAAEAVGGQIVAPLFENEQGTDWNDYAAIHGVNATRDEIGKQISEPLQDDALCTNLLDGGVDMTWAQRFVVSDEEMESIADPQWIIENLVIQGHFIVIPAPPNGGKTTIMLHLSGQMVADGYNVFYVNADVSGSDAKSMQRMAKKHGFTLMLPDFHAGLSMADVVEHLQTMAQNSADYSNIVFIFDTLKKMTDVINKVQSKGLYKTLRSLSAKGMTIICLGHTNKYKGEDGYDVFEGCGDLRADVDEMIFLTPRKNADGSMTVSTRPDKVRGSFEPVTFTISADREVSLAESFIDVGAQIHVDKQLEKDAVEIEVISEVLAGKKLSQSEIIAACKALNDVAGKNKIIRVLKQWSDGAGQLWTVEAGGTFNKVVYSLIDQPDDEKGRLF